jgi:hypothetical protein
VTSSIPTPPAFNFQIALLTWPYLGQTDHVFTPTERPRHTSDRVADVTP